MKLTPLPLSRNMKPKTIYKSARLAHHLKLKDLAGILEIDPGSLSRFEAGSLQSPKALVGYHTLFNLSIQQSITQVFQGGFKQLLDRCDEIFETILQASPTPRNAYRLEGIQTIIDRLKALQQEHE